MTDDLSELNRNRKRGRFPRKVPASLTNTLRMIGIILRVPSSPRSIAEALDITERTVFRYANLLRAAGLPIHYDDGAGRYVCTLDVGGTEREYAVPAVKGDASALLPTAVLPAPVMTPTRSAAIGALLTRFSVDTVAAALDLPTERIQPMAGAIDMRRRRPDGHADIGQVAIRYARGDPVDDIARDSGISASYVRRIACRLKVVRTEGRGPRGSRARELLKELCPDQMLHPGVVQKIASEVGMTKSRVYMVAKEEGIRSSRSPSDIV